MNISERTVYHYDGKDFSDLEHVKTYIENEIGNILDTIPNRLTPKDALAVFDAIVNNRRRLVALLSAEYEQEVIEDSHTIDKSIFDL